MPEQLPRSHTLGVTETMNPKVVLPSLFLLLLTHPAWVSSNAVAPSAAVEEVTTAVLAFNQAYEEDDLAEYFSYYREGATLWINTDLVSVEDYSKDWHALIEGGGAVEKNLLSELKVVVNPGGDAAAATYRLEVHTRYPDGKLTREQSQESDTWFKVDGQWKIAHIHYVTQPMD
jgi:ketosteroid isomerase-like protein